MLTDIRDQQGYRGIHPVNHQSGIKNFSDFGKSFDINAADKLSFWARLRRYQRCAEHFAGFFHNLAAVFDQADTAAAAGRLFQKTSVIAGTGLYLRFEHPGAAIGHRQSRIFSLQWRVGYPPLGNVYSVLADNPFGLILVNIHQSHTLFGIKLYFVDHRH